MRRIGPMARKSFICAAALCATVAVALAETAAARTQSPDADRTIKHNQAIVDALIVSANQKDTKQLGVHWHGQSDVIRDAANAVRQYNADVVPFIANPTADLKALNARLQRDLKGYVSALNRQGKKVISQNPDATPLIWRRDEAVGLILGVKPVVLQDGSIQMEIAPKKETTE